MINIFELVKESQSQIMLQGKAIDDLINTVRGMFGLGAPNKWDDMGFNKEDYANPILRKIMNMVPGSQISIQEAVRTLSLLMKYKNRQIPYYDTLKQEVQKLIQINSPAYQTNQSQPDNKVVYIGNNTYGLLFKINNLTKSITIKKALKIELQNRGINPSDVWKFFRADSSKGLDIYQVDSSVLPIVADILEKNGYDVTDMKSPITQQTSSMKRFEAVALPDGGVEIGFNYDPDLVEFVKTAKRRGYNGNEKKTWTIYDDKVFFNNLKNYLDKKGYDTSALQEIIDKMAEGVPTSVKNKGDVEFFDIYDATNGKFHIAIVPMGKGLSKEIAEFLRFSFPVWIGSPVYSKSERADDPQYAESAIRTVNQNPSYAHSYSDGRKPWAYEIRGLFSDYFSIENIISKFGYDTSDLRNIVLSLYKRGIIKKDKIPGVLDGFRKKDPSGERSFINDDETFYKTIDDNYKIIKKDGKVSTLWEPQKEGVAFLYSRQSAILGDETGGGKSLTAVIAADMRLASSGGKCLIVTLPTIKKQWVNEIKSACGDNESISFNIKDNSKWTILSYNDFTSAHKTDDLNNANLRRRDVLVQNIISQGGFTVMVLDECHMVKNNSIQTKNLTAVSDVIPYVWGLSATIIANKPIDAYRQLKIIKHRLGQMSLKLFKEYFGGFVRTKGRTRGGKLEEGDEEQVLKAAAQLRKWLTLSGIYIKRSKRDINPNLPNHIIQDDHIDIDTNKLFKNISERMKGYANPDLVVSQMQAQRAELANAKVPYSLDLARNVLLQDKKVIVFTCFKTSAQMLMDGMQKILNEEIEGGGVVLGYLGGIPQDTRNYYKELMQDSKGSAKAMVISTLTGGTGLDLPNVVDDVIMNDFSWTPKDAEQSEGRAFRVTSENDVTTTYIIADNSPDKEFYDYVQLKKDLANMISNLTSLESQLVMQGKKPVDIQQQILDLQKRDKNLDDNILKYVQQFMGSMKGASLNEEKFNLKKFSI